jgi:ubiquinone/menaquinone biosynthesis C-methylase UbiE
MTNVRSLVDAVTSITERLLTDAGIRPGMTVLDIGCGRGDVSFMLARLVGDTGRVLGVDRDASALAVARQRAAELGVGTTAFVEGDFGEPAAHRGTFDAAVGRRVLMYQADPVVAVQRLTSLVKPGGLVVFQEHDATIGALSRATLPLHAQVRDWMWRTVSREGGNIHIGFELHGVLTLAGLIVEAVRAEAIVQTPTASHASGAIVRAMLPRIVAHGVATAAEIDVETLDERLLAERRAADATYIGELAFGAWARVPA